MRKHTMALALAGGLLISACAAQTPTAPAAVHAIITIEVTDRDGAPVQGAAVTFGWLHERSLQDGRDPISGPTRAGDEPGVYLTGIQYPMGGTYFATITVDPPVGSGLASVTREYEWEIDTWEPDRQIIDVRIELPPAEIRTDTLVLGQDRVLMCQRTIPEEALPELVRIFGEDGDFAFSVDDRLAKHPELVIKILRSVPDGAGQTGIIRAFSEYLGSIDG